MKDNDNRKRVEQAEYKAKLIEAELTAVKSSKAYRISKTLGIIKAQVKSDPVGLSKKAARIVFSEPKKARHLFRSANRGAFIAQSVAEQNAKYQEWILLNEPDESELDEQRAASDKFKYQPLISIITPVFNPPVDVLEELIESVLEQTYPNFELCLGDFGDDVEVKHLIAKYAKLDLRVKDYAFTENKGIAYNSNLILEKATGEYIALLDHDDTLSQDALYENVKLLDEKQYDFIYSDKDKIDEKGNRFDPLFKPQLSPEMLLNVNYLTHLNVMKTSLVNKIGGWDPDTDGAQDWDLFLRLVAATKQVAHIPKVLYHWRVIASSTAMSIDTKPYALAGQRKAIDKYLAIENIPAKSYHQHTELFLKWDRQVVNQRPIVFLQYSNLPNTMRAIRYIRKAVERPKFVILLEGIDAKRADMIAKRTGADTLVYEATIFSQTLGKYLGTIDKKYNDSVALFLLDSLRLPKKTDWYENLTGWLAIKNVAAAGGRIVDRHDLIVSGGGLVTPDRQYFPIFHGYPRYYQSYIGNAEWVRNLTIMSSLFCVTKVSLLQSFDFAKHGTAKSKQALFDEYFLWLSKDYRLIMTPHATVSIFEDEGIDLQRPLSSISNKAGAASYKDVFSNPNMSSADPMRLFEDEPLLGLSDPNGNKEPVDRYQHDATILASTFDMSASEIDANKRIVKNNKPLQNPQSVAWFLPAFDAIYAGLMNIFSFANYLSESQKLRTTIYILKGTNDISSERQLVITVFPALKNADFVSIRPDQIDKIKSHDIGIATQWATTFPLAKADAIARKCYFIQDNEANFYPKGSISSLVEFSYRFGFMAIANTDGLLNLYKKHYGGSGIVLKSKVDLSAYYPRKDVYHIAKKPYKVFFYARPNMPRNAFELGIAGLKVLKQELGSSVEIITAGSSWDADAYGVTGLFTNLGKIDYDAVPKLYRTVDAGLMFMFSGHPGVTASELMASGCPVVVNEYDDQTWHDLYKHEETCLVTVPTASEVARNLERCLHDDKLRKKLIDGGLAKIRDFYGGYEASLEQAFKAIKKG
jgi:glycosyltransferase involved in cell wall biosynthesis